MTWLDRDEVVDNTDATEAFNPENKCIQKKIILIAHGMNKKLVKIIPEIWIACEEILAEFTFTEVVKAECHMNSLKEIYKKIKRHSVIYLTCNLAWERHRCRHHRCNRGIQCCDLYGLRGNTCNIRVNGSCQS